jgi:hypothetical protein
LRMRLLLGDDGQTILAGVKSWPSWSYEAAHRQLRSLRARRETRRGGSIEARCLCRRQEQERGQSRRRAHLAAYQRTLRRFCYSSGHGERRHANRLLDVSL